MANWYKVVNEKAVDNTSMDLGSKATGMEDSPDTLTPNYNQRAPRLVFTPPVAVRVREPRSPRGIQGRALRDQLQMH